MYLFCFFFLSSNSSWQPKHCTTATFSSYSPNSAFFSDFFTQGPNGLLQEVVKGPQGLPEAEMSWSKNIYGAIVANKASVKEEIWSQMHIVNHKLGINIMPAMVWNIMMLCVLQCQGQGLENISCISLCIFSDRSVSAGSAPTLMNPHSAPDCPSGQFSAEAPCSPSPSDPALAF